MTNVYKIQGAKLEYIADAGWIVVINGMDYGSELCLDEALAYLAEHGLDHEDMISDLEFIQETEGAV
jgi:hypothetical protein